MESEYVYKIWLTDKGGDWTDKDTWECTKLLIENATTKEQNTFYPSYATKSEPTPFKEKEIVVSGIKCKFYNEYNDYAYVETSKKISSEKIIDDVVSKLGITAKIVYFLTPQGRKTSEEYAYVCKSQNLVLIYDDRK